MIIGDRKSEAVSCSNHLYRVILLIFIVYSEFDLLFPNDQYIKEENVCEMNEILDKIESMDVSELQNLMRAIEDQYARISPEWDVVYIALHKDPDLRKQEMEALLSIMNKDIRWHM